MWRDSGYRVNHCRLDFLCSQSSAVRKAAIASGTVVARVAWLFRALLVFTHKRVAAAALEKALQPVTVTNVPTPRENTKTDTNHKSTKKRKFIQYSRVVPRHRGAGRHAGAVLS